MQPPTSAAVSAQALLNELRTRWQLWRFKRTFWKFFARWQLLGIFLVLLTGLLVLSYRGYPWGIFLVLPAVSYLARCFEETWEEAREPHAEKLLTRARAAQRAGKLNRALQLARTAWAVTRTAECHDQALEQQARSLLLQGDGTAALRELSRTSSYHTPSPTLRIQAHLLAGESSIALALARRMFAQAPRPETARLIAQALVQLQRPEEARHFSSLAGRSEESPPTTALRPHPAAPAFRPWEVHLPLGFQASWMMATTVGALLISAAGEFPVSWWAPKPQDPYESPGAWLFFIPGMVQGGLLGLAQWSVLRRVFPETGRWPWLTALGYGLGRMTVKLLADARDPFHPSSSLLTDVAYLSLLDLVPMCFQALVLGRWVRRSATWLLAMMGAAPLAELLLLGLLGWAWQPDSPLAWALAVLGNRVGATLLGALIRGLILGGVGGALLQRELARLRQRHPVPLLRPLTASFPHLFARTRPPVFEKEELPERPFSVAPMSGNLFCPGADAFFNLSEAEYMRLSLAFSTHPFVIVPGQAETPSWPGEDPPQVGVLAGLYEALQVWPGEDYRMTVRMLARVRLREFVPSEQGTQAWVELIEDLPCTQAQVQLDRLRYRLNDYIRSTLDLGLEEALGLRDPVFLADLIASGLELSLEERRALLEDLNPDSRVTRVCEWLDRALLEPPRQPEGIKARITKVFFNRAWDE
ncbi:LON peptidase substrate-binding domain-containing protein [Hyalangium versicolor]|uniref:LON peptidase substrate-binding domain-containing protein n=1 Tax=Hyalangium versicolor TaxID=2861190 RepID=UPI001CC9B675|nr:LON peptidase substrate-binding domain-containing protein [Hyalangium versicolor]